MQPFLKHYLKYSSSLWLPCSCHCLILIVSSFCLLFFRLEIDSPLLTQPQRHRVLVQPVPHSASASQSEWLCG